METGGIKSIRRSMDNGDLAKARLLLRVSKKECRVLQGDLRLECEQKVFDVIDKVGIEHAEKLFGIAEGNDG